MNRILITLFCLSFLMMTSPIALAADEPKPLDEAHAQQIERAINAGIELQLTPGAVVVAGRSGGNVYEKGFGHFTYDPNSTAVTPETVYDLASLSKVVGCTSSIMVLVDQGKISVTDPVSKYIPQMNTPEKKDITIEQCLLHQAGFVPDNDIKDYKGSTEAMLSKVYATKLKNPPGKTSDYSDLSFIVLGEVVKAAGGKPLKEFAQQNVFGPLGMKSTAYNPPEAWHDRIAPTEKRDGKWIIGEVHDPRAYALGGYAGHAGVFASGADVARFCRMILNKGELDGRRIVKPETVALFTKPHSIKDPKEGTTITRGLGFDIDSKYSAGPRGKLFPKGQSFGHTGYTGTSFWIDPTHDAFVVLLTNRVHPDDDADVKALRKRVSTIVAEALMK
ncbi:MAG TPA: serine hydrolase domain-containing protein [Tepidisphaeraceae bacterium]|jgi:CubicO group peptidase (beta-lactamase class C family)